MMRRATIVVLSLLLAGCSIFSRSKSTIYSLETIPPSAGRVAVSGPPVGINAVELPPGTDRREITVRKENLQLDVRSNELWASSLEEMVLHTLAFDLAARLPEGMMILPGSVKPAGAKRSIDLIVEEIGAGPEQSVVIDARWIIRVGAGAGVSTHERVVVPVESFGSPAIAAGMSRAIAELADRIAARL
jgi:uncharacterized lipoprotein YmbA